VGGCSREHKSTRQERKLEVEWEGVAESTRAQDKSTRQERKLEVECEGVAESTRAQDRRGS
jgi:hypothetical protein